MVRRQGVSESNFPPAQATHLAAVLGLSVGQVGVKATTNERMGFPGREEGMCAMAIATVDLPV